MRLLRPGLVAVAVLFALIIPRTSRPAASFGPRRLTRRAAATGSGLCRPFVLTSSLPRSSSGATCRSRCESPSSAKQTGTRRRDFFTGVGLPMLAPQHVAGLTSYRPRRDAAACWYTAPETGYADSKLAVPGGSWPRLRQSLAVKNWVERAAT